MIVEKEYRFEEPGINNTDNLMEIVRNEIYSNTKISAVIISTTTGYTAKKAEEILRTSKRLIFCGQDISEEFSMSRYMKKYLREQYKLFEIPSHYLKDEIGKEAVQVLRHVSQGFKVCIEMLYFLGKNGKLEKQSEIVLIAGTLKGADTAILVRYYNLSNYCIEKILCRP